MQNLTRPHEINDFNVIFCKFTTLFLISGSRAGPRSAQVKGGRKNRNCYDRGGFPGDTLDRVRKYGVNAQELVTTSSTRLLMTT